MSSFFEALTHYTGQMNQREEQINQQYTELSGLAAELDDVPEDFVGVSYHTDLQNVAQEMQEAGFDVESLKANCRSGKDI